MPRSCLCRARSRYETCRKGAYRAKRRSSCASRNQPARAAPIPAQGVSPGDVRLRRLQPGRAALRIGLCTRPAPTSPCVMSNHRRRTRTPRRSAAHKGLGAERPNGSPGLRRGARRICRPKGLAAALRSANRTWIDGRPMAFGPVGLIETERTSWLSRMKPHALAPSQQAEPREID